MTYIPPATNVASQLFFPSSSPWNTLAGASYTYSTIPNMPTGTNCGLSCWSTPDSGTAIWYAASSDPVVNVSYNINTFTNVANSTWARSGNNSTIESSILSGSSTTSPVYFNQYSTQTPGGSGGGTGLGAIVPWVQTAQLSFHCPTGAIPNPSSDGQTVIIQPNGTAVEMYSPILLSTGNWVAMMFSVTHALTGSGTGTDNGRRASSVPNYAGLIRDYDVTTVGAINHALALLVPQSVSCTSSAGVAASYDTASSATYSGNVPMGSLLVIPPSTSIASLSLSTALGTMVANAAQKYGSYTVDTGGAGVSYLVQTSPLTASLGTYNFSVNVDLGIIMGALRLATYSAPTGNVYPVRVIAASGTITHFIADNVIVVNKTTGAATAITLVSSPPTGQTITIKDGKGDAATHNITITPAAGNIDGSATLVMSGNYAVVTLMYNGTQWNIVSQGT